MTDHTPSVQCPVCRSFMKAGGECRRCARPSPAVKEEPPAATPPDAVRRVKKVVPAPPAKRRRRSQARPGEVAESIPQERIDGESGGQVSEERRELSALKRAREFARRPLFGGGEKDSDDG